MFEELQSLSQENKKRLLVVGTIIIMAIVVGVWITYFNSILIGSARGNTSTASPAATATSTSAASSQTPAASLPAQTNGPGLWQDIKNGFGWFGSLFSRPSQYKIQPK